MSRTRNRSQDRSRTPAARGVGAAGLQPGGARNGAIGSRSARREAFVRIVDTLTHVALLSDTALDNLARELLSPRAGETVAQLGVVSARLAGLRDDLDRLAD